MRPDQAPADAFTENTLDLRRFDTAGQPVFVDLDIGTAGALNRGDGPGQLGVLRIGDVDLDLFDVENIIGTDAGERLFGSEEDGFILARGGDDTVHPFNGDDFVDAGEGVDTLLLNAIDGPLTVNLAKGFANTATQSNTVRNFENVTGSNLFSDNIRGDRGANVISGGAGGDDTLKGAGGDDTLLGGAGRDRLAGGRGDDALQGDDGDDRLNGGAGSDVLTGGAGADRFIVGARGGADAITDFDFAEGDSFRFAGRRKVDDERDLEALALDLNADDSGVTTAVADGEDLVLTAARASIVIEDGALLIDVDIFLA